MTLEETLTQAYTWADLHAVGLLVGAALIPVVGTILAWIGRGGRTDADGKFIASAVMGFAILAFLLELVAVGVARGALGKSPLEANVLLLLAPPICLGGAVVGIRRVFPLSELGSVRTAVDLGAFLLACLGVVWLMSRFRWGVLFVGSVSQLVVLAILTVLLLRRLWARAFGGAESVGA